MAAARRQGYRWPSVCGGMAQCATCYIRFDGEGDEFSPMLPDEVETLRACFGLGRGVPPGVRLACQVTLRSDITVSKRGVRAIDITDSNPPVTRAIRGIRPSAS